MANYILQEMNDIRKSGERKVYPKMEINRMMTTDDLIEKMKLYNRALSPSIIKAVLQDLSFMMSEIMSMGYSIKLDGIGNFSISLGFDDNKTNEIQGDGDKMLYRKVSVKDINYKADPELIKQTQKNTTLTRVMSEVKTVNKTQYSMEERIERALDFIERHGQMTLSDYASTNNMSRSAASRDLKRITAQENSPIITLGSGTHKAWSKR